jgi:hypothetical protein
MIFSGKRPADGDDGDQAPSHKSTRGDGGGGGDFTSDVKAGLFDNQP